MNAKRVAVFSSLLSFLVQAMAYAQDAAEVAATPEPPAGGGFGQYVGSLGNSLVYILVAFVLFFIAKVAYVKIYRRVNLNTELFGNDNTALAVSTSGYYFGILLALGGTISGPSSGLSQDVVAIGTYGILSIALMIVASFVCEHVLLPQFKNTKEVVEDHNMGTAYVEAGLYIANGLILFRCGQGTGPLYSTLVFWGLAQVALIIAGRVYEIMTPHKIHEEIERDNAAVGLAFGGALAGMGNIVSAAVAGDFYPDAPGAWSGAISTFAVDTVFGLVMLLVIHRVTDIVLAPGVSLAAEQTQEKPNVGAGLLEAVGYFGASMLVVWSL